MKFSNFTFGFKTMALAAMTTFGAWAAEPATMFSVTSTGGIAGTPWTMGVLAGSKGKVKIFDKKPKYTQDEELTTDSIMVKELRNPGDTYIFDKKGLYYIIFYPKYGKCNFTATLYKTKDTSVAAKFNVNKIVIPGVGGLKFEVKVTPTKDNNPAGTNVDNFEAVDGDPDNPNNTKPEPIFILN